MGQFTQDGVVYEELPGGQVRVVGYADSRPTVSAVVPPNPAKVARDAEAEARARDAAARDRTRFDERNQPTLPAGYQWSPDHQTATRIPGLPPEEGASAPKTESDLAAVRAEAIDKIRLARSLQQRSRDGWFTTGFGSGITGSINGTPAYDLAQDTETLKNAGALTRIMEMSRENGGKNPLTPLSNSDFQALASSLSNLETGQSDEQYQRNVQRVIDLYTRAYQGAGGKDLEGDIDPAKKKRSAAVPAASAGQGKSVDGSAPSGGLSNPGGWQFRDEGSPASSLNGMPRLSPQDEAFIAQNARFMTPETMERWFAERKMPLPAGNAQQVYDYYAKGGKDAPAINPDERAYLAQLDAANAKRPGLGYTDLFQNGFAASGLPALAGVGGGIASTLRGDGFEGGYTFNRDAQRRAIEQTRERLGVPGAVAEGAGIVGGSIGLGQMGAAAFPRAASALPAGMRTLVNDMSFGAAYGANEASPGEGLDGAVRGSLTAGAGNLAGQTAGRFIVAPLATSRVAGKVRRMFGAGVPEPLSPAESMVVGAAGKGGLDDIRSSLTEAQGLGVPMSLADTSSNLRTLAGSAVRRSPTASGFAEDALIPRSRGQIDRFSAAVERDLGPVGNIPQMSEDLIKQARARAAPLYDEAYASPVVSTPELDALLNTPFGRQGLSRARTIAANERRDPEALGFRLDADGNVVLEPTINLGMDDAGNLTTFQNPAQERGYTTQTLDYAKRGMDDVLEQYRNPITGRLELDEAGKAQNGVLRSFLGEVDRINPAYGQARAAYAGPAAERDAMRAGQRAYSQDPNTLGVQMQGQGQTPERIGQMQLGYRDALMNQGNKVRYSSNPFDATLGTPQAEARLRTMYPETASVDRLLRTRDLERGLAATTNDILGNSKTAQRLMADQAFGGDDVAQMGLDAIVNIATGQVPVGMVAKKGIADAAKDAFTMGVGKRAMRKADELAPILMNPDPGAALSQLDDILARNQAYADYVGGVRRNAVRAGRMFAAPLAIQYSTSP